MQFLEGKIQTGKKHMKSSSNSPVTQGMKINTTMTCALSHWNDQMSTPNVGRDVGR